MAVAATMQQHNPSVAASSGAGSSSFHRPPLATGGGANGSAAGSSYGFGSYMASSSSSVSGASSAGSSVHTVTQGSANGRHQTRPSMHDRSYTSASSIDSPMAANSIANRTANGTYGLYQTCLSLRKQLRRVPGFKEAFLDRIANNEASNGADDDGKGATSPLSPTGPPLLPSDANDPVSQVLSVLQLGSPLCFLWNVLGQGKRLEVNPEAGPTRLKLCQKSAALWIMETKAELGWKDEHETFTVSDLYSRDTNGTVKVINTITNFLRVLDERGLLLPDEEQAPEASSSTSGMDGRSRVVKEILDSERKYVQDLEVLQEYQRKLAEDGILSQDTIHNLFLNLNAIVDFARKFLIGVEANACLPPEQQRFGSLFLTMEEAFAVYEPYCKHFIAASELAANLARQENSPLTRVSHILDPIVELTMFHIKPVQRLLKYYLLYDSLAKKSEPNWPYYQELVEGTECAKRIADRVNEETRKQENRQHVEDLKARVEDWKGHDINAFGELLLSDTFVVLKADVERDYNVYLFQKIILCCKEAGPPPGKKMNKSNSMIRKSAGSTTPGGSNKRPALPLHLKGRIFINNISMITTPPRTPNQYLLQINWRGDSAEEAFGIKCRTPDLLAQWKKAIDKAVDDLKNQRRSRSAGQLSRRLASPHSQFPNTPQFELPMGGMMHGHSEGNLTFNGSSNSLNSGYAPNNPYGGTFDDDGDEGYVGDYEPSTGRSTPSLTSDRSSGLARRGNITQSMPAGARQERDRDLQQSMGSGRPRAQTEDSNSAVIHQWRSQTPNGGYPAVPALPRQSSTSSSVGGQETPSLRHSASKGALRHKQSHEWGAPPLPSSSGSTVLGNSALSQMTSLRGQSLPQQVDEMSLGVAGEPVRMLRQNSQGTVPYAAAPPMRSRSASSPNVYQLNPAQAAAMPSDKQWSPYPMENVHPHHLQGQRPPPAASNGNLPFHRKAPASQSTATLASAGSSTTIPPKRLSSSSTGTDRSSGDSSQSQGLAYASPTSPVSGNPLHGRGAQQNGNQTPQPPMSPSSAVKLKVNYGEDTFVIVARSSISYRELAEKVVRKIHLCGARSAGLEAGNLRLRYEDEDGDRIVMKADDDVAMAFDWLKSGGGGVNNSLVLYAE